MRMMLRVHIPTDTGNSAVKQNQLGATIHRILEQMKPEAAYFTEDEGMRTGFIVFDMQDSSQLPGFAEPWFLAFNARVTFRPAMTVQDLAAGDSGMQAAAKAYGGS